MTQYMLNLSDPEIERYQFMAKAAEERERDLWAAAGAVPGAQIADVGSGPGAVAVRLASLAAPDGAVWAVDRDSGALAAASALAERSDVRVHTATGAADATGLAAGTFDLVMLRHVLAHNGGREQEIVNHLAMLARPGGGAVYLVDIDTSFFRMRGAVDPALHELSDRYGELHRLRGNDLTIGNRLDELLTVAGLEVVVFQGHIDVVQLTPDLRGPAWAARDALLAEGLATADDIARWDEAFQRSGHDGGDIRLFTANFIAVGRRP